MSDPLGPIQRAVLPLLWARIAEFWRLPDDPFDPADWKADDE
jgi:hypothetical protein